MPVSLVCCGLIGTMVDDGGMVDRSYAEAIATQGVVTGTAAYARCMAHVHNARGQYAVEVLREMFPDSQARAQAAHLVLDRSFCDAVSRMGVTPVPGAEEVIEKLTGAGIRICLITSFSRRVLTAVLGTLGWWDRIDLALSPQDVPRGAPWPDLVLSAMLKLGVTDVRETAVAHDAESGILCGRRAGAGIVAGVLTGAHSRDRLRRAGATHLIPTIAHLPALLQAVGEPAAGPAAAPAGGRAPGVVADRAPAPAGGRAPGRGSGRAAERASGPPASEVASGPPASEGASGPPASEGASGRSASEGASGPAGGRVEVGDEAGKQPGSVGGRGAEGVPDREAEVVPGGGAGAPDAGTVPASRMPMEPRRAGE